MAMARVCDSCSELISGDHKQLKVLNAVKGVEPREYKTVRSLDLHEDCYKEIFEDDN